MCSQMQNHKVSYIYKSFDIWVRNYLFLKNHVTSEGAVSNDVLYYQQLSIACFNELKKTRKTNNV